MVVSKRWFEFSGGTKFRSPLFTSILPLFNLFFTFLNLNLTSASSRISNHGLETAVYRLLALGTKTGKRPIKVGKRPINEGKRPIKAMVLVGISTGCLMGCFRAPPPWRKTAPLKGPLRGLWNQKSCRTLNVVSVHCLRQGGFLLNLPVYMHFLRSFEKLQNTSRVF